MPGLGLVVCDAGLAIETEKRFVKQAPRRMHQDLVAKIELEVDKSQLHQGGTIPSLLASIVSAKKKNGKIRVCSARSPVGASITQVIAWGFLVRRWFGGCNG